jgi:4-amino-4-deoxy-L-arabinose transferase-like glycosyltransferase/membrane-associated phospholipid phosphatase
MEWLQTIDVGLFRFINQGLSNPVCDTLMPFVSGDAASFAIFYIFLAGLIGMLLWKGGARGAVFLLMLALALAVTDGLVCNSLKQLLARPRPFKVLADVHCLTGMAGSGSMPSSHAANWFSAMMVCLVYYRRSVWIMLPMAILVGFSRVYNGVHYPSDVVVGSLLGAGSAAGVVLLVNACWQWVGRTWFPLWWQELPNLLRPVFRDVSGQEEGGLTESEEEIPMARGGAARRMEEGKAGRCPSSEEDFLLVPPPEPPRVKGRPGPGFRAPHITLDQHWLRLGYILIAALLVARLAYLSGKTILLCEDEAYQWLWSKHLALSYYSKPPLIALTQFLGTTVWGDTAFGVRFFAPLITGVVSFLLLRFFAREVNGRAGLFLVLIGTATPLLAAGAILMTVDPLSAMFWTAAMLAGWRAVQEQGTARDWFWVGLWMGLGLLSKYTALLQWLCWAVFFILWQPARRHLKRPGPYVALLVNLVCALPVLIWNMQRDWVTVSHVADDAGRVGWQHPVKFPLEFLGGEVGLLNPVFFIATVWAAIVFWRRSRHNPRLVYFFSMGAPLFLVYLISAFRSRALPNWISPAVLPLLCLMVLYWDTRLRLGSLAVKRWLAAGLVFGFVAVIWMHNTDIWRRTLPVRKAISTLVPAGNTNLLAALTREYLPMDLDPLRRVRGWDEVAVIAGQARETLLKEGKPVFIITEHYGMTGLISFYLPEARKQVSDNPLVYFRTTTQPENQFFFWPGYTSRVGESAICVVELGRNSPRDSGRVAGAEATTLVATNRVWKSGQWEAANSETFVWIVAGPGSNQCRRIVANTADSLTIASAWDTVPDATSRYVIGTIPPHLFEEFDSVTNLGVREVFYRGQVCHAVEVFACRGLRQRL